MFDDWAYVNELSHNWTTSMVVLDYILKYDENPHKK